MSDGNSVKMKPVYYVLLGPYSARLPLMPFDNTWFYRFLLLSIRMNFIPELQHMFICSWVFLRKTHTTQLITIFHRAFALHCIPLECKRYDFWCPFLNAGHFNFSVRSESRNKGMKMLLNKNTWPEIVNVFLFVRYMRLTYLWVK